MDKSTNFWKLATIALLFLVVFSVAFYSFEFNHISKNRGFKETIAQEKHSPESIIPINQKEEIRT